MGSIKIEAVKAFATTIGLTEVRIQPGATETRWVQNATLLAPSGNTNTVFIGGEGVTVAQGFPLEPGAAIALGDLFLGRARGEIDIHEIFAISDAAGQDLRVIHEEAKSIES